MALLDELNPAQRAAATHGLGGGPAMPPLLVIAGAGTGKTKTLAHRVAQLVLAGAEPRRILLLTFSRRAAEEMVRRVGRLLEQVAATPDAAPRISWAGTFHAIGHRLLRIHAEAIGLEPGFSVLDREDAADLMDLVRDELGLGELDRRFPRKTTCLEIHSRVLNAGEPLEAVLARQWPWCAGFEPQLKALFKGYAEAKRRQVALDYDDLLLLWERLMAVPELGDAVRSRCDHVLVDEYQDTNALQASILAALAPDGRGVTVVGDDAQAIYGFRGATVRNILDFPGRFAPPATVVTLERNYRSTQPILDVANAILAEATEGYAKRLEAERGPRARPVLADVEDDRAQVDFVVARILANREAGIPLIEQAVLFRTASHSAMLEIELARRNIPFVKWGGLRFLEAAHVKDVLAILRWATNPRDRLAAFRTLRLLPGIGPGIARRIVDRLHPQSFAEDLGRVAPPAAAAPIWPDLVTLLRRLVRAPSWPDDLVAVRTFYDPLMAELYDAAPARAQDLDQLAAIAARHADRAAFVAELVLDPPDAVGDEAGVPRQDEEQLILSTIHSAKGQEWRAVYVLNCVDGCIPSDMATGTPEEIEEERRLLYVAVTRAKDDLVLCVPRRFYVLLQRPQGDRHVRAIRTRFVTDAMLGLFDRPGATGPRATPEGLRALKAVVDLRADLARMWD